MNMVVLIVIPATVGLMVLSTPITQLFFGRGAMDSQSLMLTSSALFFYSIGTIGYGLRNVLTQTFYSLQDSVTPVISGVISVIVNISLNIILAPRMGVAGLALATSVSALIGTLVLYYQLSKKVKGIPLRKFGESSVKTTVSSLLMGLVVYLAYQWISKFNLHYILPLGISIIAGVGMYAFAMHFMKVPEYDETLQIVKNKLGL